MSIQKKKKLHERESSDLRISHRNLCIHVCRFINHYKRRRWPKLHGVARHDRSITRDAKRALNCFRATNDECHVVVAVAVAITACAIGVAGNIDSPKQDRPHQISAAYIGSLTFAHFPDNINETGNSQHFRKPMY